MSAVSLMVLGLALVLALNSSSVVHDGRSDTHRQQSSTDRPPIRTNSAALNQPAEDPTITYVLYSDQSQIASLYLAVVDAHSEVRTVALNTGIKHAPDPGEVVFFHVTHPEDEAEAMMLIKDLMADAAVRGSELNVLDLRSSH